MNTVAEILGKIIQRHFAITIGQRRDCRLLVPGITKQVASDIHRFLRADERSSKHSFLVVAKPEEPDAGKGWLYAEGLTTVKPRRFL